MHLDRGYIEFIEEHIPPGFFVRVIEEFEEDYSRATSEPFDLFDEPEAHDVVGNERRARTETSLVHVARQFQHRGITAEARLNLTFSHYHREIVSGPVVLTSSCVSTPNALVREARFRDTLARSRQISFLDEGKEADERGADRLYAVILHGFKQIGGQRLRDTLGFVQLAIPNRACNAYEAVYNLARRYADVDIDPEDIAATMQTNVPIDPVRRPSALLRQYRRESDNEA